MVWIYNIPTTLMVILCSTKFVGATWIGIIFI
jgi:hypothetical protein